MDLALEKVERKPEGLYVTHTRAKQRTDKKETRFLVPSNGDIDYAALVDNYLSNIRNDLGKFSGRMFWTGTPVDFRNSPMGKNTISVVPKEMAKLLGKESSNDFTFHSLRRTSATAAADNGATVQQLMDFYGWQNTNMPQEYVSTSKAAVSSIAQKLQGDLSKKEAGGTIVDKKDGGLICMQPNEPAGGTMIDKNDGKVVYIQNFSGTFTM